MLTFDQAKQCILQQIPPCTNSNPMEEWIIDDKRCCEYPDYWYIWGNARGFVEYGDTSYLLVGSNGYLVDKCSDEIIALSNRFSPEQYIQDRQNERAAAGKHYVLRYVQPENPHARKTELLKLKHLFHAIMQKFHNYKIKVNGCPHACLRYKIFKMNWQNMALPRKLFCAMNWRHTSSFGNMIVANTII